MKRITESLRDKSFWWIDKFKGAPIRKHLNDIDSILGDHPSVGVMDKQGIYLSEILKHAILTTPYYKELRISESLDQFPVINKTLIRENFEQFRSVQFRNKPFIPMTTSGSTGTPFTVYQDLHKKARNYADTLYFARLAGYELGQSLYYLKIWSEDNKKRMLQAKMQNIYPVDVLRLGDEIVHKLIRKINRGKQSKGILAYTSALEILVQYVEKNNLPPINNVKSVITISETLTPFTRDSLMNIFKCPVVSRYSNLENGILAQQCIHSSEFHVNSASYKLEIFDFKKDEPVSPGTLGRIIVTDLFNYAMPMIRYDTGDIGIISLDAECDYKTQVLTRLEGRKLDLIYNTSGELISSYLVYKNMWRYTEINQYQLIQEGEKQYTFKINISGRFTRERLLIDEFKSYLGIDADFRIEYVSEIPLLSSGKRKKIVNNYIVTE